MHDKKEINHQELEKEIERGNFVRAALIAKQTGLPEEEKRRFCYKAIGQMSIFNTNANGTKFLAQQYGYSRVEVKSILTHLLSIS
jgi:hypothetical protein